MHNLPDNLDEGETFHEGLRLFNGGEWFDAHEVWEDIWRLQEGQKKLFYQGLIQCAVVLEHVRRGNPRGVKSVWGTCVTKFEGLPEIYMGVNVRRLLAEMSTAIDPILSLPAVYFEPGRGRGQALPFDAARAPTITLAYDPFASKMAGQGDDKDRSE